MSSGPWQLKVADPCTTACNFSMGQTQPFWLSGDAAVMGGLASISLAVLHAAAREDLGWLSPWLRGGGMLIPAHSCLR